MSVITSLKNYRSKSKLSLEEPNRKEAIKENHKTTKIILDKYVGK